MRTASVSSYTRELTYRLQLREIDGARIGQIVAEVESHVAESGEAPEIAFGPAKAYAGQFGDTPPPWWRDARTVACAVAALVGGWWLASGFFALVFGTDYLRLPAGLVLALGLAVLLGAFLVVPLNTVLDPRRPRPRHPRLSAVALTFAAYAVLLGIGWLASTLLA